jgi:predicted ATPase/pimeloyl-ACP methyl ester carboxylesterase/DNA-binding winged helix-turn-helix (wHTH) protein
VIFEFDDFELDTERFELRRSGRAVHVEPQVFDVLRYLVDHRDRVVSKEELLDNVWGDRFVSESALTSRIKGARQVVGDTGRAQRVIATAHGRGYRFLLPVVVRNGGGGGAVPAVAPADRHDIRYARSGAVNVAYEITGGGPVDVLLVPGFVSHLEVDWDDPRSAEFLTRLGGLGRLIRFDKRGTGLSDRPAGVPDLDARMDDVRAVMDAAGSESAVVFGYSEGGPLAALFAATFPARVRALVLYGSYAKRVRSDDYPWAPTLEERLEYAISVEADWGFGSDMQRMCPNADEAMAQWWQRRARAAASPAAARALVEMNSRIDIRDLLPTIRVPTLVLHRRDDPDSRADEGRFIADRIPGARFIELDGVDHAPWIDSDQVLAPIEEFVGRVVADAPRRDDDGGRALATTLLTDIVGSTDMNVSMGDARWSALLDRHDRFVKDAIEQWRGRWVKSTGDGALAVFDGPARALRAAITLRERLAGLGIRIRAGLHASEIEQRGDDIAGVGVVVAARLCDLADPGEILATAAVRDLVAGTGIELVERGSHELKGVPGRFQLVAVATAAPAVTTARPPAEAEPRRAAGNLPQPRDPFLGRDDDLARVGTAFQQARIVTLAGPGGVGKTRLAIEVARTLDRECWFVDLTRVSEEDRVAAAFLDTLGASPRSEVSDDDRVVETLATRSVLLVVDNCEHVVAATAEIVGRLDREAPGVTILATSRQALGLDGEQVLVVAPLTLPELRASPEQQRASDAVQMFCDRAERAGATIDDIDSVVELCRRLDGMPLALELAAARTRAFSVAQIVEQLAAGWSVAVARREGPAHHLSLDDAIDWSYRLLDDDNRALFLALSTFRGAFDLAAVSAVAGIDPMTAADRLVQLVDQSLVQSTDTRAGRRFRLLGVVRAFALARTYSNTELATKDRHAAYFANRVDELGARVPGPDEDRALEQLTVEFDDVLAAFTHAADAADADTVARLAYGPRLAITAAGARWARLAGHALSVPGVEAHARFGALVASAAWSAVLVADLARARALAELGAHVIGDPARDVRLCWIWTQATGGSFAEGADCCLAGAALAQDAGDDAGASFLLATSSIYRLAAGDEHAATAAAQQGYDLARVIGSRSLRARAAGALSYAALDVDPLVARRAASEVLEIADDSDFHLNLPHRVLATLAWRDGDTESAARHATEAAYLIRDQGDRYVQGAAMRQLAAMVGPADARIAAEVLGVAEGLMPELRVMARDERAQEQLLADLRATLGDAELRDLLERARSYDARAVADTVERALDAIRVAGAR